MVNNNVVCHLPVLRATEVQENAGSVSLCIAEYLSRVGRHRGPAAGELDIPHFLLRRYQRLKFALRS